MVGILTGGQVAKALGVSRTTVWKWRLKGKIAYETILLPEGRVYAYPSTEVDRLKEAAAKKVAAKRKALRLAAKKGV